MISLRLNRKMLVEQRGIPAYKRKAPAVFGLIFQWTGYLL